MRPGERLEALQNMEYSEAGSQGRGSAVVVAANMGPNEMGNYNPELNQISINQDLLLDDRPDRSLATYFHEERHAQQRHAAELPAVAGDPEQAQEWANNFNNYISPEENFPAYENQAVEVDAREYAAQRMGQFETQQHGTAESHASPERRQPGGYGKNIPIEESERMYQAEKLAWMTWPTSNPGDRLGALQKVENSEAELQSRTPCCLEARNMPDAMSVYDPPNPARENHADEYVIAVNAGLLENESPEAAFHAYYHAERGAQQHYASILSPSLVKDDPQQKGWAEAWKNGDHQKLNEEANEYANKRTAEIPGQEQGNSRSPESHAPAEGQQSGLSASNARGEAQSDSEGQGHDAGHGEGYSL
jgi:hypothetical protein